jgi:hypothetical protein
VFFLSQRTKLNRDTARTWIHGITRKRIYQICIPIRILWTVRRVSGKSNWQSEYPQFWLISIILLVYRLLTPCRLFNSLLYLLTIRRRAALKFVQHPKRGRARRREGAILTLAIQKFSQFPLIFNYRKNSVKVRSAFFISRKGLLKSFQTFRWDLVWFSKRSDFGVPGLLAAGRFSTPCAFVRACLCKIERLYPKVCH